MLQQLQQSFLNSLLTLDSEFLSHLQALRGCLKSIKLNYDLGKSPLIKATVYTHLMISLNIPPLRTLRTLRFVKKLTAKDAKDAKKEKKSKF